GTARHSFSSSAMSRKRKKGDTLTAMWEKAKRAHISDNDDNEKHEEAHLEPDHDETMSVVSSATTLVSSDSFSVSLAPKSDTKKKHERHFQDDWKEKRFWPMVTEDRKAMWCSVCDRFKATGTKNS